MKPKLPFHFDANQMLISGLINKEPGELVECVVGLVETRIRGKGHRDASLDESL